ncbi:MAG: antirestriction protein [Rhodoferax sp.]
MAHIISTIVPESLRMSTVDGLFALAYSVQLEPTVFSFASALAPDYQGAYWDFYTLSNGGFYMAPRLEEAFAIECDNGFDGQLSADALGIAACLYSYSHLSMEAKGPIVEVYTEHYHWLREFALDHSEAGAIMQVID